MTDCRISPESAPAMHVVGGPEVLGHNQQRRPGSNGTPAGRLVLVLRGGVSVSQGCQPIIGGLGHSSKIAHTSCSSKVYAASCELKHSG